MYRYETHLHTFPVSQCAKAGVRETIEHYKALGWDGVFLTNHFLDGNIGMDSSHSYAERLDFYFSDYNEMREYGERLGIKVFSGVELSMKGTDFLIYGPEPDFYYAHPEIMDMNKTEELRFLRENGALTVQAHPFREAHYIDHIRLFPRSVEAVETVNAARTELANRMADIYAENYGLMKFAGSDNHTASAQPLLAGMECETPLRSVSEFIEKFRHGEMRIFVCENRKRNF